MAKRQQQQVSVPLPPKRRGWLIGIAVALLPVAGGWLWWAVIEPRQLYQQAQAALDRNPRQAAELLEAAVTQSGGRYPAAQLLWSRVLLRLGQPQDALGCFSLIPRHSTLDADQLIALAEEARQAGEFLLATFALEAVPPESDRFIDACQQLMELKLGEGRLLDVLALGQQVKARQPGLPLTEFLLARAHDQLANPQSAAAGYQAALDQPAALQPEQVQFALHRLLRLALQLGELDRARRCLNDLERRGPLSREDRLGQAELLRLEGNADTAWSLVEELLQSDPGDLAAVQLRATLAFDRRDDAVAERDLRTVLQSQPYNKQAHYQLAQVLHRTGRTEEAETHFRENRRLTELSLRLLTLQQESFPDSTRERNRLRELADVYASLGQPALADRIRQQLPQMPPGAAP